MARFLIRILCSLALVLAAWPAGASAAPCVMPVKPAKQKLCKMPCCAKASMKEMACHEGGPQTELKAKADCSCELKATLPVAIPSEKATLTKVQVDLALPPARQAILAAGVLKTDIVVISGDSSPPGDAQRRSSSPRAPPVVRV